MNLKHWKMLTAVGVAAVTLHVGSQARADESNAILDLLEHKGVITHEEAEMAKKYYLKQEKEHVNDLSKFQVGSWMEKVQLFGDARTRFEWRSGENQAGTDNRDRDRWRFRVRFGLKGEYQDNFFYGLRVETSTNPRSTNVTIGDSATGNGPFAKNNNGIGIGQVYAGWKPTSDFTFIIGRQEIPFVNTSMVWDDDLNPEGAVEKFTHTIGKVDLFANFGQFIYADFNENNFGAGGLSDVWMLGWQAGAKVKFTKDVSLLMAPTLYHYIAADNFTRNATTHVVTHFAGSGSTTNIAINDLMVLDVPVEFAFKLGEIPAKVFGDFAVNLSGSDRAKAAGDVAHDDQIYAYQVGASLGSSKKKHDWQVKAFWQHAELYSLDPNLVDSDIFDSRLNMEGFAVQSSYFFTDFLSVKVTYANGTDIERALPTLNGAGDIGSNLRSYQLLQTDLNWKF